jgi:hypothetical protein
MKYQQGKSGLITSLSNGSVAFWSHDPHGPEFILDCHSKLTKKLNPMSYVYNIKKEKEYI